MKIEKGIVRRAARVVIYGVEGIGKTTLAASLPKPLILDVERGSTRIDCDRVAERDWSSTILDGHLQELIRGTGCGYQTVVIDSIDRVEALYAAAICGAKHASLEEIPYGKGWVMLGDRMRRFLADVDQLVDRGVHVVMVGHAKAQRWTPPDLDEGFDRWELRLTKHVAPLVREWCDALMFANYRTSVVTSADGKKRGRGGRDRVLHCERAAAYDAKNRYGLPGVVPMAADQIAVVFGAELPAQIGRHIAAATTAGILDSYAARVAELLAVGSLTDDQAAGLAGEIEARRAELGADGDE